MQALRATAQQGSQWFGRGWHIFRRQPFAILSLTMLYMISLPLLSFIPVLGPILGFALIPAFTFGFMEVSRLLSLSINTSASAAATPRILPTALFAAFMIDSQTRRRFIVLGVWYVIGVAIAIGLSGLADGGTLIRSFILGKPLTEKQIMSGELILPLLVVIVAYVPVWLSFWYAPALMVWEKLLPAKALFFSLVAAWRNKAAFTLYGLVSLGWLILVQVLAGLVVGLLGEQIGALLAMPFTLALIAVWQCSFYPTYVDVFGQPGATPAVALAIAVNTNDTPNGNE